jgi:hypothetical protein
MNLVLSFVHPSKPAKSLGPFHSIRLDGETVRDRVSREVIATSREHQWAVGDERYFRLDCTARVRIYFERLREGRTSREFGPYQRFSAVDGIVYTDDRVFAFVDAKAGDWFCYNDGQHWPVMIVTDASAAGRASLVSLFAGLAPLAAGVIGFWQGAKLSYLGRTASIAGRLAELAEGKGGLCVGEVSAITWEVHADPARREAELLAEYESAARTLPSTYGAMHGNVVRTARLVEIAAATLARSRGLCAQARALRYTSLCSSA